MKVDIQRIIRKLLVRYPTFGSIIANLHYVETTDCLDYNGNPTAGTDAESIFYHPDYINSLSESEQVFIFAHEVCHVALNHIYRSEERDPEIWNYATDAVINAFLKQDGLSLVEGSIDVSDALSYDAEELYQRLLEKKKQQKDRNSVSEKENSCVGHDTHAMWKKAIDKKQQKAQAEDKRANEMKEQVSKIEQLGEKKAFEQNKSERKKELEKLRDTLAKQSAGFGDSTNSSIRNIEDIGNATSFVDWTTLLSQTVKGLEDWSFQNASIEYGVVTPHLEEIEFSETEILLDTSGSISTVLLRNFLRECKNILQNSKMRVGCFDTKFYGFHEIRDHSDIDAMPLVGGGGTDFSIAVNAFTKNADNKIIFTDGYASMPTQCLNAIWIVFGSQKINPPGGKVIYIDKEQLTKLCNFVYSEIQTLGRIRG